MRTEVSTGRTAGSNGTATKPYRWATTVNIVPIDIPNEADPDLTARDRAAIFGGCVVVITTPPDMTIITAHRLARAIGDAVERGAAAIVLKTPTSNGAVKLVCWSQSPTYRVGAEFSIDITV